MLPNRDLDSIFWPVSVSIWFVWVDSLTCLVTDTLADSPATRIWMNRDWLLPRVKTRGYFSAAPPGLSIRDSSPRRTRQALSPTLKYVKEQHPARSACRTSAILPWVPVKKIGSHYRYFLRDLIPQRSAIQDFS